MRASEKERRSVEAAVLDTYRKENPSTYYIDASSDAFAARGRKRLRLFRDLLKFPPKMFEGASLLDFGAGTGENTIYYAKWGARCTLVEVNGDAIARARAIFDAFADPNGGHQFVNTSLFDFATDERFDIVVSNAVLHCTADKEGGFDRLCQLAKPDGWVVLGIASKTGNAQRMLQRMAVFAFAEKESEIEAVAERLFREHIDRAQAVGGRSRRAIIYDTYVNPKWDQPSVAEVLEWFRRNHLVPYSAWPPVLMPLLGDSGMHATFDARELPEIGALAEMVWFAHDEDDAKDMPNLARSLVPLSRAQDHVMAQLNDFQMGQRLDADAFSADLEAYRAAAKECHPVRPLYEKLEALLAEVETLVVLVDGGDIERVEAHIRNCRTLFRGTAGLGMNFYIGRKEDG